MLFDTDIMTRFKDNRNGRQTFGGPKDCAGRSLWKGVQRAFGPLVGVQGAKPPGGDYFPFFFLGESA